MCIKKRLKTVFIALDSTKAMDLNGKIKSCYRNGCKGKQNNFPLLEWAIRNYINEFVGNDLDFYTETDFGLITNDTPSDAHFIESVQSAHNDEISETYEEKA